MKPSKKMWLVMVLGACLLLAQYHLSNTWIVHPGAADNNLALFPEPSDGNQLLKTVVERLQLDNSIAATVGQKILKELVLQVGRELIAVGGYCDLPPANTEPPVQTLPQPTPVPPPLYIITPTYRRPEQIPELTRMGQTLMHVPHVHWLVIEDAANKTVQVTALLERMGVQFEHLLAPMPGFYKERRGPKPRGVSNRNRGLQWLRKNATAGVFYFADDDNTYDIQLFEEIRTTRRVSMWPVGLCTKFGLSSPIVANGSFAGFYDGWLAGRKFPVDMAGFAVSVGFLLKRPKAFMPYRPGFEEDGFLKSLAPFEPKEVELKAENCTRILVWHTQTKRNEASAALDMVKYNNTNLLKLKKQIV